MYCFAPPASRPAAVPRSLRWTALLVFAAILAGATASSIYAQASISGVYEFTGGTLCTNENPDVSQQPSGGTYSAMQRGSGTSCHAPAGDFRTRELSTATTVDPVTSTDYVGFTISIDGTSDALVDAGDLLSVYASRSNNGPRKLSVYYRTDTQPGFIQLGADADVSTIAATHTFEFPSVVAVAVGGWIEFRLFGFDARKASGRMRIDNVEFVTGSLPVELTSFTGRLHQGRARLDWVTQSETANAGWQVEHRASGQAGFRSLGFVDGRGTTALPGAFSFSTGELEAGRHEFRLRQLDLDGAVAFSATVELTIGVEALQLGAAYPNPFSNSTTLRLASPDGAVAHVDLYDITGRHIRTVFRGAPGMGESTLITIDADGLAAGVYVLRAISNGSLAARRVVVTG